LPNEVKARRWLNNNHFLPGHAAIMAERMATWSNQPTFHLLMTINSHELSLLSDTLTSLEQQLYSAWGMTILSNGPQPEIFDNVPDNIEWVQVDDNLNDAIDLTCNTMFW